jgi:hypothetical protein
LGVATEIAQVLLVQTAFFLASCGSSGRSTNSADLLLRKLNGCRLGGEQGQRGKPNDEHD